jgi:hypothetical protein
LVADKQLLWRLCRAQGLERAFIGLLEARQVGPWSDLMMGFHTTMVLMKRLAKAGRVINPHQK